MTSLKNRRDSGIHGLLLLCVSLLGAGMSAEDLLNIDFSAGYDGTWQESRSLAPVHVTISNKLQNLSGRIEITHPSSTAIGTEVVQVKSFQSPNPSVQRFTLLARTEPNRGLQARVVFDQKVPSESKTWYGGGSDHIILDVGLPLKFKNERDEKVNFSARHKLIRFPPPALPLQRLAYDGVYAVMITGRSFQQLNGNQVQALRDWLVTGGRLMLLNPTPEDSRFAKNIQIITPDPKIFGTTGVNRFGAGLIAVQIQVSSKEKPFWCQKEMVRERNWFLPDVLDGPQAAMTFGGAPIGEAEGLFAEMTRTETTYGLMGFLWLLLIIGAYIVVIGPLDYWLVKRTGKPWLTWIIFSSAIAAFSLVAYWYSGVVHSSRMQVVRVNLVDQVDGENTSVGNSLFWVYSTKNTTYNIKPERSDAHLSGREGTAYSSVAWVRVRLGAESQIEARIPIFSAKTFDAAWQAPPDWKLERKGSGDGERFILPKALNVRKVALAEAAGVYTCKDMGDNHWTISSKRRSWNLELDHAAGFHGTAGSLPEEAELERYLFFITFAEMPIAQEYQDAFMMRAKRGAREVSLDISEHLKHQGRVLLVYLEPENSLLPLKLNLVAPETAEANLLRIQLPPAR